MPGDIRALNSRELKGLASPSRIDCVELGEATVAARDRDTVSDLGDCPGNMFREIDA